MDASATTPTPLHATLDLNGNPFSSDPASIANSSSDCAKPLELSEAEMGLNLLKKQAELIRLEIQQMELELAIAQARRGNRELLTSWQKKHGTPWAQPAWAQPAWAQPAWAQPATQSFTTNVVAQSPLDSPSKTKDNSQPLYASDSQTPVMEQSTTNQTTTNRASQPDQPGAVRSALHIEQPPAINHHHQQSAISPSQFPRSMGIIYETAPSFLLAPSPTAISYNTLPYGVVTNPNLPITGNGNSVAGIHPSLSFPISYLPASPDLGSSQTARPSHPEEYLRNTSATATAHFSQDSPSIQPCALQQSTERAAETKSSAIIEKHPQSPPLSRTENELLDKPKSAESKDAATPLIEPVKPARETNVQANPINSAPTADKPSCEDKPASLLIKTQLRDLCPPNGTKKTFQETTAKPPTKSSRSETSPTDKNSANNATRASQNKRGGAQHNKKSSPASNLKRVATSPQTITLSRQKTPSWITSIAIHSAAILALMAVTLKMPEVHAPFALTAFIEPADSLAVEVSPVDNTAQLQTTAENEALAESMQSQLLEPDLSATQADLQSAIATTTTALKPIITDQASARANTTNESLGEKLAAGLGGGSGSTPTTADVQSLSKASFFGMQASGNIFCYVVDNSGSMRGEPFDATKQELLRSISRLKPNQRFYVLFFNQQLSPMRLFGEGEGSQNSTAMVTTGLVPATKPTDPAIVLNVNEPIAPESILTTAAYASPENFARLQRWIDTVSVGSGGPPNQALKMAIELQPDCIFLLTDGVTRSDVTGFLRKNNRREDLLDGTQIRCQINTIGFYSREGEMLLQRIASENGGQYVYVPNPRDSQKP